MLLTVLFPNKVGPRYEGQEAFEEKPWKNERGRAAAVTGLQAQDQLKMAAPAGSQKIKALGAENQAAKKMEVIYLDQKVRLERRK